MTTSIDDFIEAIRAGDVSRVTSMLAAQPELSRSRRQGASAVLIARYYSRHDIVALLRSVLSELDIFEAAALGDRPRAEQLLDESPHWPTRWPKTASVRSAWPRSSTTSRSSGCCGSAARASMRRPPTMRVMPLHSAVAAHSVPIARLLLEHGAPVNARQGGDGLGFTPLMEAAYNGQRDMVELLLAHGADPSLRDDKGATAADHARQNRHETLADRLG